MNTLLAILKVTNINRVKLQHNKEFIMFIFYLMVLSMCIKSKDYSTKYDFLKRIISADDVVSDAFR